MSTLAELAQDLTQRSDAQLARLLALRSDAMTPPVANFADLASRLTSAHSINLALDRLNLPELQTLRQSPAAEGEAWLPLLHELALVIVSPLPADDAGSHHFLPLPAVRLALGAGLVPEAVAAGDPKSAAKAVPVVASRTADPGPPFLSGPFQAQPPMPHMVVISRGLRDNAASSAIESLLRHVSVLLEHIHLTPLDSLRGGTVGVRTVRKLAKDLEIEEALLCFYLELAAAANLLHFHDEEQQWWATDDSWHRLDRSEQWLHLSGAWLGSTRIVGNKPLGINPNTLAWPIRRFALSAVLELVGAESAAPAVTSVVGLLCWRHPRHGAALAEHVPDILREMELMGITGAGAPSAPGQALGIGSGTGSDAKVTAALAGLLPEPIEHFVIQGDLTAIAPGFLSPAVAARLKCMAAPEGQGAAAIVRFSQTTLEAAMTGGMAADSIRDFLHKHSSTTVPQSLDYLITAAARRVKAQGAPQGPLIHAQLRKPPKPRQPQQAGSGVVHSLAKSPAETDIAAQILRLRSQPTWGTPDSGESGPALVMEELRQAIRAGTSVWLRWVNAQGEVERAMLRPVSLAEGTLRARVPGGTRERRFSIHRIMAVEAADAADPIGKGPDMKGAQHG
ncbi:helicase-associated domain-containing protein [Arthrobacter sp. TWP1-1]|uniref:helicase-associated domain-containing protein n=1 Tax=Arthrobacter sp. TWP1-1 TaxID=2804568 RepID=UPI003CEA4D46